MKQYRPLLFIFALMCLLWTLAISTISAQQLKQIQKGTARNQIPATNGIQYTQVYRDAIPYILDTLGIRDTLMGDFPACCLDSIFIDDNNLFYIYEGDTIDVGTITTLTDTTLINQLISDSLATIIFPSDSTIIIGDYGVTAVETSPNTWTLKADTSEVATPFDLTFKENVLTFTSPLTRLVNTVSIPAATTSVSGHLTSTDWNTFNIKVGGTGSANKVAYWTGANTQYFNSNFHWDNTNGRLAIGNSSPQQTLHVTGRALIANGSGSTFIGSGAGNDTQTGFGNFGIGSFSAAMLTSGVDNVGIGNASLREMLSGNRNIGIGASALLLSTTGDNNVAIGHAAMQNANGNTGSTAIGFNSLYNRNSTVYNTAIGWNSLRQGTTGNNNTALGAWSLYTNNYRNNVGVGSESGYSNSSGENNVFIGYASGFNELGSNRLYIEPSNSTTPLIGGHFDNNRVGINTLITDIGRTLDINGEVRIRDLTTTTPTVIMAADATGVVSSLGTGTGISITGGNLVNTGIITEVDGSPTNEKINSLTWNDAQDSLQVVENGVIYRTKITGFGTGNGTVTSVAATAGTGISVTGSPITTSGTLNITNTAPDQVVSLTGGGITSITGAYPNFTVSATEADGNIGNEYNTSMSAGFIGILPSLSITDSGGTLNGSIPLFSTNSSNAAGVVPGSDGSTSKFLNASGGWVVPTITEVGDISAVTVSAPVTGGGTSGSVNIGVDTTSSTGLFTQYDGTIKQNTLVSGVTIKTVNSNSLLGSGNVSVGTVTSVGIVNGGGLTVSGSPITTSGNITITAADQSESNEYNTAVTSTYVGNLPAITITDNGGAKTGVIQVFSSDFAQYGSVPGANGLTTSFLRGDGQWAMPPSGGITSLGGQIGSTQTFATTNTGTYPAWFSNTNTHTFRMPAGANGQVLKHDGAGWTAGADAGALSGTLNAIPYFNTTSSLASMPITYSTGLPAMVFPTGNAIHLVGTATIIDRNNSYGGSNEILSKSPLGGVDWIPAPTLVEVDGSKTNEGFLGVSDGGATSSIIQGYNDVPTAVGLGVTINAGNGMSISETFSTNGGGITLTADAATFGQMHRTTNISGATFDAASRIVEFTNSLLSPTGVTFTDANDELTVSTTGQYEVTYSLSYRHSGGSLTVTDWAIYKNGVEQYNSRVKQSDDASAYYMTVSKTFIMDITASSDEIRLHYQRSAGTSTQIDINAPVVTLKRLN